MNALIIVMGLLAAPSPTSDEDDDGLTLAEEEHGWNVTVNRTGVDTDPVTGYADALLVYEVKSDPVIADTDGDGLTDGEERAVKTDPTMRDTDMDGLGDGEEVNRWGTSPTSVDTDGDARGFLADRTVFPYARLFDGAELQLVHEPDGSTHTGPFATSPILDDTDGDGVGDYEELLNPLRSAVVAETPKIDMRLSPDTLIEISLNATRTDGSGDKVAYTTSVSGSQTWSAGGNLSIANDTEWYSKTEVKASESASYDGNGVEASATVEESVTVGLRTTNNVTLTFTGAFAEASSKTEAEAKAAEESHEVTIDSGTVRLSVDLTNTSEQTFTIGSLSVVVGTGHGVLGFVPLGELRTEGGDITLAPGDRATVTLVNRELEAARVRGLVARPGALILMPYNVALLDEDGVDYDFRAQEIRASTALIQWSPTPEVTRIHYVAANASRSVDAEPDGVILGDALIAAGIGARRVEVDVPEHPEGKVVLYDLGDAPSQLHQGVAPDLHDPPYVNSDGPGPRLVRAGWFAYILRYDPLDLGKPIPADWTQTRLYARDRATLIRSIDNDRDGVPAHLERVYGTFDDAVDSDLDGLSDFYEMVEGWTVHVFGAPPQIVFSSPVEPDADLDGLTDADEQLAGTNPNKADTDDDGFSDYLEVQLAEAATDAGHVPEQPQVSCTVIPTTPPQQLVDRGVCAFEYSQNDSLTSRGVIENGCRCSAAVRLVKTQTPFDMDEWAFGSFLETCGGAGQCTATSSDGVDIKFPCNLLRPGKAVLITRDDADNWLVVDMPLGSEVVNYGSVNEGDYEELTAPDGHRIASCVNYTPWSVGWDGCPLRNAQGQSCSPESSSCKPVLNQLHWIYGGNPNSPTDDGNLFDGDHHSYVPELAVDPLLIVPGCSYFNHIPCAVADKAKDMYVGTRRLEIEVQDPQGDLVSVRLDNAVEGYRTEWPIEPTDHVTHTLPTGWNGGAGNFVVTATDAVGMTRTVTCADGEP